MHLWSLRWSRRVQLLLLVQPLLLVPPLLVRPPLLAVELATGAGRGAWFDADGWLAPAWPQILPDMAGTIELMLVGAQWIVVLGVVVAATAWAWLSLGGGRSLRFPPRSQ